LSGFCHRNPERKYWNLSGILSLNSRLYYFKFVWKSFKFQLNIVLFQDKELPLVQSSKKDLEQLTKRLQSAQVSFILHMLCYECEEIWSSFCWNNQHLIESYQSGIRSSFLNSAYDLIIHFNLLVFMNSIWMCLSLPGIFLNVRPLRNLTHRINYERRKKLMLKST